MAKRRWSYYDSYWPRYEPTRPIEVKDGIKAKSQRGGFVKNWWADRWIKALRPLMDSGRLSRGRSYARKGQVIEINVAPGHVTSRVQGSRRTPYKVDIRLKPLDDGQWDKVLDALAEQAIFAAQLLNGEMPPDIEEVFEAVKVPLFPASRDDLQTSCSCPDWANPCKHIAAVYYLLGERFDEDPFLLFGLRGRNKDEVAAALRERRAQEVGRTGEMLPTFQAVEAVQASALGECLDHYWALGAEVADVALDISHPEVEMALLKRLGVPDFLDESGFAAQMARVYDGVTTRALEVAFADSAGPEGSE
ncbi:MAG: SWIM zinc finger family protein [Chloroflexi bacterium]|nr:SWIM zinc finger family protein [Chloroflexota bacterium]